jgi:hypothetical protein
MGQDSFQRRWVGRDYGDDGHTYRLYTFDDMGSYADLANRQRKPWERIKSQRPGPGWVRGCLWRGGAIANRSGRRRPEARSFERRNWVAMQIRHRTRCSKVDLTSRNRDVIHGRRLGIILLVKAACHSRNMITATSSAA